MGNNPRQNSGESGSVGEPTPIIGAPIIEPFVLGPYETNCYLVRMPGRDGCWFVDAGFEPGEMIERAVGLKLRPRAIVLTHAHLDHIAGVSEVLRAFPGTPVLIHEAEKEWLGDPELNLSAFSGIPVSAPGPTRTFRDGDQLELEGSAWRVLHTPGHSPGGVTLYHAPSHTALVGDALFAGSIGRTDFPGCSFEELAESIRTRLYTLPEETKIFPGHGPSSTIGREKKSNPFVRP
jgi:glyoxylase-like metal-dependent hydrolase (beta-lactamase superfamily II)